MKMIRAIIRPESADEVTDGISRSWFFLVNKNQCVWTIESKKESR